MNHLPVFNRHFLSGLAVMLVFSACGTPETAPRYALEADTTFAYSHSSDHRLAEPSHKETGTITFWVADVPEVGRHILYYELRPVGGYWGEDSSWGKLTLHADGAITDLMPPNRILLLRNFLPPVPGEAGLEDRVLQEPERNATVQVHSARATGWFRRLTYKMETLLEHAPYSRFQVADTVIWSRHAGIAEKIVEQEIGLDNKEHTVNSVIRLKYLRRASRKEVTEKVNDIEAFLQAQHIYYENQKMRLQAPATPFTEADVARWHRAYVEEVAPLRLAWRRTRDGALRDKFEYLIDRHVRLENAYAEHYVAVARMLGQPAPDWEQEDIEGNCQHLESYRGKVVLLYFATHWMPRTPDTLPAMKALHEHFRGHPFALIGMDVDRMELLPHIKNAVKELKIEYPVLMGATLKSAYLVNIPPVFIIIDTDGVVRHHKTGYSNEVKERLIEVIEQFLPDRREFTDEQ